MVAAREVVAFHLSRTIHEYQHLNGFGRIDATKRCEAANEHQNSGNPRSHEKTFLVIKNRLEIDTIACQSVWWAQGRVGGRHMIFWNAGMRPWGRQTHSIAHAGPNSPCKSEQVIEILS